MIKISRNTLMIEAMLILIIGYLILAFPDFEPFPDLTTRLVAMSLAMYTGVTPAYYNNHIFLNFQERITVFSISAECSGVILLSVFALIIFITPHIRLRHRFCALLFLPLIYMANIFRIVSGIIIGDNTNVKILHLYHSSVGQVLIFMVMIVAFVWFLKLFGYFKYDNISSSFKYK